MNQRFSSANTRKFITQYQYRPSLFFKGRMRYIHAAIQLPGDTISPWAVYIISCCSSRATTSPMWLEDAGGTPRRVLRDRKCHGGPGPRDPRCSTLEKRRRRRRSAIRNHAFSGVQIATIRVRGQPGRPTSVHRYAASE